MWRVLSQLNERLAGTNGNSVMLAGDAVGVLNQTLLGLAAFHGLARENMTRAQAWRFLDMGLRLERAVYLGTLLDATLRSRRGGNPACSKPCWMSRTVPSLIARVYNLLPHVRRCSTLCCSTTRIRAQCCFQIQQLAKHFERLPLEREAARPIPAKASCRNVSRA